MASWTKSMGVSSSNMALRIDQPVPRRDGMLEEGVGMAGGCPPECPCDEESMAGPEAPGNAGISGFYYVLVEKSA